MSFPDEEDFRAAITALNEMKLTVTSEQLWTLARNIQLIRGKPGVGHETVYFHANQRPFDKNGRIFVHAGHRAGNGLFSLCDERVPDTTVTFTGEITVTCERCLRELDMGKKLMEAVHGVSSPQPETRS